MVVRQRMMRHPYQVGVDLDGRNAEPRVLQQQADRAARDALPQAADHATRDDYVLHGCGVPN